MAQSYHNIVSPQHCHADVGGISATYFHNIVLPSKGEQESNIIKIRKKATRFVELLAEIPPSFGMTKMRVKRSTKPTTRILSKYSQALNTRTTRNLPVAVQNRILLPEKNRF
jgi:hypothetical protein